MKNFRNLLLFAPLCLLAACANDAPTPMQSNVLVNDLTNQYHVSESDAIEIANKHLGITRGSVNLEQDVVALKNVAQQVDTLAYVMNMPNDGGFVLVAADSRMPSVLAYSDSGRFEYDESEDDPVFSSIVSVLPAYKETLISSIGIGGGITTEGNPINVSPLLKKGVWNQMEPFNYYVNLEHPGKPLGCVALAITQIAMNCKDTIVYNSKLFDCKNILQGIADSIVRPSITPGFPIVPTPTSITLPTNPYNPVLSYDQACRQAALLAYYIAKDINTDYTGNVATAYHSKGIEIFNNLGFYLPESSSRRFDPYAMMSHLQRNRLLYMSTRWSRIITWNGTILTGSDISSGHTFIIDGCKSYVNTYNDDIPLDIYFHCDWGSNGQSNGYYYYGLLWMADLGASYYEAETSSMVYFPVPMNQH